MLGRRTATYFKAAAELRSKYGINRLLLATDDADAAQLCAQRVLGFDCVCMRMDRQRFKSYTSIERRVVKHQQGSLDLRRISQCPWPMAHGPWPMASAPRPLAPGFWPPAPAEPCTAMHCVCCSGHSRARPLHSTRSQTWTCSLIATPTSL